MKSGASPIEYSKEPDDKNSFTEKQNKSYSKYAGLYDLSVKLLPFWKTWLKKALPHVRGRRVLEVSFGTGYLLTKYARNHETYGIDYNQKMVDIARRNCEKKNIRAHLQKGNVENLPFDDESFDTILITMAFTGYPDADRAMSELRRTLKQEGLLILIDFNYPENRNRLGVKLLKMMENAGDIIRDMPSLFHKHGFCQGNSRF